MSKRLLRKKAFFLVLLCSWGQCCVLRPAERVSHSISAVALREATPSLTGIKAPGSPGLGGSRLRAVLCLLVLGCLQKNLVKHAEKEVGFSCSWR